MIPRFRAICCSGSTSSFSWAEDLRWVFRVRTGERGADSVRLRWVLGFGGLLGVGLSSTRESSFLAESRTNCMAILWHWLSSARSRKVSMRFTRNSRQSCIWAS